ncbi:MAG: isoleucine--tRNA ligase [Gammaproteobacteria bacterium 39-13]|nr:isoleucine--tRNA ligase [Gammaproteobacteria bacterium]OJV90337.1 MAG: isoleucine--tRNA ligase [Gammaproteobacteria bacterium 39-13]
MTKVDYKDTLNLPKTEFPMRANLPQKEPKTLEKWTKMDLYKKAREHNKGKKKFILHMGPPYANGDIHIGHALTTILKDIITKSKALSGFDAPLVPGWDCHGLPIEVNVEKKIGMANVDVTPKEFRKACREYAKSQVDLQKTSFIRLGISADWENPYMTMAHRYEADIVRSVGAILKHGDIQPGAKPVHWCVNCGSALAEAEVEYQNKTSPAIDVAFRVVDTAHFLSLLGTQENIVEQVAFAIWTTTPWTLPANQAVTLHPDLDYVLVKGRFGENLDAICVLSGLLEDCLARYGITEYEVLATFKGKQVEKQLLQHPFYHDRKVPLILGEHVTTDAGTGAVHTAPAHGLEDYIVGVQYGLKIETEVDDKGCFLKDVPQVGGLHVFKANDKIIEILKENNNLLHATALSHSYPHCWRHKTPLIFRATPQWFISMEKNGLRKNTLAEVEKVKWVPNWGQSRMGLMIEGRPDWCISRQRTWGVPLPFLLHKQTNELHPNTHEIIEIVAKEIEKEGIEAWHEFDISALPFADIENYRKSQDVLDVWFESGVSHTCVLKAREDLQFPADLYLEGSDQHRGWFQSSLLSSTAMYEQAPYRSVLTHGFTVDAQGRKMSKSLGNVVAPEKVVKTLGADILRLWVASTDYKNEIHVSDEILNRMSDAYRRIRNTIRFLLANLDGFDPKQHLMPVDQLIALDKWIIDCAALLQDEILQSYESYQFHNIYHKIHNFCIVELGSFYLDVIKDRQYTTKTNSRARRSAQTAMYYIAHALTRWLAPILSFTAEEIWEYLPGATGDSVFFSQWLDNLPRLDANTTFNADFWQKVMAVRNQVNKALEGQRAAGKIGAPLDAEIVLYAEGDLYQHLHALKDELRFVLITSSAVVKPMTEKQDAIATELPELWLSVKASEYEKCARCWHHREDVNKNPEYPQLCGRCVENVDPSREGESRNYA